MKKLLLMMLVGVLVLSGCSAKMTLSEDTTMEYGADPMQLITETDAEEVTYIWKDAEGNEVSEQELKTDVAYTLVFAAAKPDMFGNQKSTEFEKEIILVDTTVPVIESTIDEITLEYGTEEFDFCAWVEENVTYTDGYSEEVKVTLPEINSTVEETVSVSFEDEHGNVAMLEVSIKLQDTTAPVITAEKTEFTITVGDKAPAFENYATAYDIKDGEVTVTVENDWNSKKVGTYDLLFVAVDAAGNRAELPIVYTVKAKPGVSNNTASSGSNSGSSYNSGNSNSESTSNASGSASADTGSSSESGTAAVCPGGFDESKPCDWSVAAGVAEEYPSGFSASFKGDHDLTACKIAGDAALADGSAGRYSCVGVGTNKPSGSWGSGLILNP